MTREAELLIDMWDTLHRECHKVVTEENYDVIKKAIKALEQLTSYEQTINKLTEAISEQATILDKITDEISALIDWHDCPIEYDNGNDAWYCEACNQAIKIVDKYKARREETE